ncbi:hypothetical protein EVAR_100954_1 [Eumeta japonica]|uniref:Uncharacterized protein n=1 Tax=Eumeta variegata TaxID=151549 RepID=A0A4C2A890_EUMVA|nr:hypothetical protein EVAR_100954_1 [Eumeta japonica]
MLTEATSAMEHMDFQPPSAYPDIEHPFWGGSVQIRTVSGSGIDIANKTKSRIESRDQMDANENGTMVGIECGIKIRTKSMFGTGIRNGAEVREIRAASTLMYLVETRFRIKSETAIKVRRCVLDLENSPVIMKSPSPYLRLRTNFNNAMVLPTVYSRASAFDNRALSRDEVAIERYCDRAELQIVWSVTVSVWMRIRRYRYHNCLKDEVSRPCPYGGKRCKHGIDTAVGGPILSSCG